MLRAYNDWHIDEWCGAHPGRFVPLALPPIWDVEEMAREVHRVAKKGCHAITFADTPGGLGYPSLHSAHWDPFWKACSDEGTVVCIHIGSSGGMHFTAPDAPVDVMITTTPISIVNCATDLLWSQAFKKFPVKVALSEGGIGWIPYLLERADYVFEHHHAWTHQGFGGKRPSDVFREHILTCFIDDAVGVKLRHEIGVRTIMWECDYPHSDTTWPHAPERLMEYLGGVPDDEIRLMTHENALREFRLDAFAHRPRDLCRVGALRAEARGVDLAERSIRGGKPPSFDPSRPVTTKDVTQQLMSAFSTPAE
jgi:predicted TIM-barrel fold metal-dependent hydrolase